MLKLYHGSNVIINEIDLCLSRKGKDFGCGFYLNPDESQAMEMAIRTTQRQKEGKPIVNTFIFDETVLTDESSPLSVKVFVDYSKEWAEFILMNRKRKTTVESFENKKVFIFRKIRYTISKYSGFFAGGSIWQEQLRSGYRIMNS